MMVTIHGLPVNIKYQDLKAMIKQECKISDFILDNLVCDTDGFRKVRVGLADDIEGAHVIKCLNGYRLSGYILRVAPVGKSGVLNQANQLNQRGFQSQSYQGQTQSDYGRADQPRVDPWSSSQWSANQPIAQPQQNSYGYQQTQQMNTYSPANVNQAIRPQYDQRQSILSRIGPPSQGFAFAPKNEVPTQAAAPVRQGVLRAVDIVDTSHMANRHVGSYDVSRERSDMARDRPELARERSDMARDRSDMARDRSDMARNRIDMARDRPDMTRGRPDMSRENVIMKDHFQGPEYGSPQQGSSYYQDRNPWAQQQKLGDDRKFSADKREIVKEPLIKHSGSYKDYDKGQFSPQPRIVGTGRNISPTGKRIHQSGRDISPSGRQIPQSRVSPSLRRISPSGRRVSPPGRRNSPPGRRISPSGRRISPPGRRISPSGRRISPPGRRISPSGRRISPPGRRISPGRHASPHSTIHKEQAKRNLPGRQSPDRRDEGRRLPPGQERYSPTHIEEIRPAPKQVRPAYEPPSASNQPIYSGGYRPNINENVQYPQGRPDRWSDRVKPFIKHEEDRREPRMSKFDSQRGVDHPVPEGTKRARSQNRESRSPKRDRSPIRDRYRRHSPSPRSPRRSWALEKRRSPDDNEAPPPPSWPGQDPRGPDSRDKRQSYPDRTGEARPPTWEIPKFEPKTEDIRREPRAVAEEKRHFDRETIAVRKDLMKWKPISTDGPKHPSSRYNPDDNEKFAERHEHEDRRYKSNYTDANDLTQIKEELSRRIEKKTEILKKQEELQKEIEDVYKRAVDFTKKAEMYKKGDRRHEEDYRDERRQDQHESKHYDRNVDRFDQERRNRDEIAKKPYIERNRDDFRPEDRSLEEKNKIRRPMSPSQKAKRDKAGEEISEKLLSKYGSHLPEDIKTRVIEEIKFAVSKIFFEMFGNDEVSFIEMVVKFNSKHNIKDQEKIFDEVMKSFPSQYRKRPAQDESGIPSKTSKPSPTPVKSKDGTQEISYQIPNWDYSYMTQAQLPHMDPANTYMSQQYFMTMQGFVPTYTDVANVVPDSMPAETIVSSGVEGYNLYLCKDDFQPINGHEANTLKEHLIQQMLKVTQSSQGWAPDFTLKGLQSPFRYEVVTKDIASKDWLLSLDFSEFQGFNVLVYTKEELWYERAAVWLPSHSKCRNIEPLMKLKLQNRFLEGVNIGKWKLVKKIVTAKGTRIYVDMPPSSARSLENHKMMLSYELQKVNVFLKAVAVDKDAFDAGLKEPSIRFLPAPQNAPMPSINQNPNVIKFCLKGDKPVSLSIARRIKDSIIYKLFQHHQLAGHSRTDFVKYGFMTPGYFGVLPENNESKNWLLHLNLGYINRQAIVVMGGDDSDTRYIKMFINLPEEQNASIALERLRNGNQGVKGINFNKWKYVKVNFDRNSQNATLAVEMDMESVETIVRLKYQLDYVGEGADFETLTVRSEYSHDKLNELLEKYKEEQTDTYVVANMEIASDESDDDVVCLDSTIRKMPVKYPTKALPQRSPTLRTAEHKKLDIKSRPEVVKQKTDETARKTKTEESQKTGRKDDEVPNEDAADTTAVKKETDESIQEMFPEDIPETERELDPLTTRLLEYELRHIMIKVWQEFPDDPPTDDEKLVAEKFRNEAGDDIRNVIGLNVTKRLLNIHNRLIVKVRFSSRPEKSYLLAFLKKYKIRGFKRVASEINTFAAQLKTIEDFDRICAEKVISCGNAKLTITPCYTFMKCPPKLKTKFVDEADDKDEEKENPKVKSDTNNDEEESIKIDVKNKVATEEKAGEKKNENKDQIESTTTKANPVRLEVKEADIKPKEVNKPKVINKPDTSKPGNIQTPDKETSQKSEVKKVTNAKIAQPKENSGGKINENKTDETEKSVGLTAEKNKETAKNETINTPKAKQAIVPKSVKAKIEPPTNNIPTKTVPTTKTPQKFTKPTAVAKRINKAKETAKVPSKKIQSGKDKSKDIKTVKNQSKMGVIEKYDDYDEMDDEDILALLSEGVVLDECGSDDE
ncbi:uncharacterized protein LOC119835958 [Zerene cesonia]|uniref:uncharacterized protein LOC119835958 n=1 Tax=Zerene cesonia TaxID=33412 RepID=UPI0018E525D5|nr:uncharacterized protein LOC119835958 [Zerene cesonia]